MLKLVRDPWVHIESSAEGVSVLLRKATFVLVYAGVEYQIHTEIPERDGRWTAVPVTFDIVSTPSSERVPQVVEDFARANFVQLALLTIVTEEAARGAWLATKAYEECFPVGDRGEETSTVYELEKRMQQLAGELAEVRSRVSPSRPEIAKERSIAKGLRFKILERDNFTCTYCGAGREAGELKVDHIVPVSKGGKSEPDNLTTACEPCNAGKSARLVGA